MLHIEGMTARIVGALVEQDGDIAQRVLAAGCPHCGARLHAGHYGRKPRGISAAWEAYFGWRWSFCCSGDDCRRRATPPSVRFLGRKVYVGAVVVLAATAFLAMVVGGEHEGRTVRVPRRTVRRWRRWWTREVPATSFWHGLRGLLPPLFDVDALPASLLAALGGGSDEALCKLLRLVCPLSTQSAKASMAMGA